MAGVAGLQFGNLPAGSRSLSDKGLEERPRRITFRNASNERGWNLGLPIVWKENRFLEATQTKITQPRTREITCFAWLQSPEIKLAFSSR